MPSLRITCNKCGGPMWEEDEPGTNRVLSLCCLYCGRRNFVNKPKYLKLKKMVYEKWKNGTLKGGVLSIRGSNLSSRNRESGNRRNHSTEDI